MKRRAFTLIELLTVIGIITLLTAIIIPVMSSIRNYARATRCRSNIKQITLGLICYDSRNENFPYSFFVSNRFKAPQETLLGNALYDTPGLWWLNYIVDQSKDDLEANSIFWCPSRRMEISEFKCNVLVANYGVNQSVCKKQLENEKLDEFAGSSLSSADIRFPSKTLLVVDSGYATINWHNVTNSPPVPLRKSMEDYSYLPGLEMNKKLDLFPEQKDDAENGRHLGKKVNIGFVDGHIDCLKAEELFIEKTPGGYKNLSPLWIPQRK